MIIIIIFNKTLSWNFKHMHTRKKETKAKQSRHVFLNTNSKKSSYLDKNEFFHLGIPLGFHA